MARILHLSDVHIAVPRPGWRPSDWASKHLTGWVNWRFLGRARSFRHAADVLSQFARHVDEFRPDLVVFSGDACALGFPAESAEAARLLRVRDLPGIAVPGNHDHYTRTAVARRGFEDAFAPWLVGERVDGATYPFARRTGSMWFVGVNSAVPNRGIFDASGLVGPEQLDRLDRLLSRLGDEPKALVTHYPFCTAEGQPEPRLHGLRDRDALAEVVRKHGIELWFSGHRHRPFQHRPSDTVPLHVIGAGSATQRGTAGCWEVVIKGKQLTTQRWLPETTKAQG